MVKRFNAYNDTLGQISQDFQPLQPHLSFITFTEDTPIKGMKELVSASKVYPPHHADGQQMIDELYGRIHAETEWTYRISGDHLSLCKFRDNEDDRNEFELVVAGIRALIDGEPAKRKGAPGPWASAQRS